MSGNGTAPRVGSGGRDQEVATLGAMSWFRAASPSQLHQVARHACRLRFAQGSVLIRAGTPALDFVIVVAGRISLSQRGQPLGVLGPGCHACDLDVLARSRHRHDLVALNDVDVLVIDRRSLYGLLDEMPGVASRVVSDLAQRLRTLEADEREA